MSTDALAEVAAGRGSLDDQWLAPVILNQLPVAVWLKDPDGRYLGCNREFERFYGADEAHILGRTDREFVSTELAELFRRNDLRALAADGPVRNEEWVTYRSDGRSVLWETTKTAVRDPQGRIVGVLGFGIEVTDRVAAHEQTDRQRSELEEAERLAHVGHWNHEHASGRLSWSNETYRIFGVDPATFEPTVDALVESIHPDDRDRVVQEVLQHGTDPAGFELEFRIIVDGQVKHVENRGHTELDDEGHPIRTLGTVQDRTERVLRERRLESFYRLAERASDAIVLIDVEDGTIVDANVKTVAALRAERADVIGAPARDFVPQLGSRWLRQIVAPATDIATSTMRAEVRRMDGSTFPADISVEIVHDEHHRYAVAVARDVTAQVEHERSLQYAVDQYRALLRGTKDGFLLVDRDGIVVDANDVYCELSGYGLDELVGMPISALNPHVSATDVESRIQQVVVEGAAIFETAHRRKDGSIWPVEVSISYADVDGGRLFTFFRDLTERHRAERDRRLAAERWDVLVNGTPDGFTRLDLSGRILEANEAYAALVGRPLDELVGTRITEFDVGFSDVGIAEGLANLEHLGSEVLETRIRRPDGTDVPVEIAASYSPNHGGQVFSFLRDISERHRAAEAIELSAKWFEAVLAGSSDGFLLIDTSGHVVDADDTYAELSGYERDELVGLHIEHLVATEDPAAIDVRMASILREGSSVFESVHRRRDGSLWPVEVATSYTELHGGRLLTFVRDITDRHQAEAAIRDGADRYRMLLAGSSDGFARIDLTGTILEANDQLARMFACPVDELVGRSVLAFDVSGGADGLTSTVSRVVRDGSAIISTTARRSDGTDFPMEINLTFVSDGVGQVLCFARDITDRVESERQVREGADRYAALLSGTNDGFCMTDLDGRILEVNAELCRLTGYDADELIGMNGSMLDAGRDAMAPGDVVSRLATSSATTYETWMRRKDGSVWRGEISLTFWDADGGRLFGFVRDVTDRREAERRIEFLAYHDPLTELPNRQQFAERLSALIESGPTATMVAVCLLDLDGFKPVNDTYGHEAGDVLLVQLAQRLRRFQGPDDLVARIGGDEFVLMRADVSSRDQAAELAAQLVELVAEPFQVEGHRIEVSASVGVTVYPDDDHDADTMLRHADQAMYEAKGQGNGAFSVFDTSLAVENERRRIAIAEFELAIDRGELVLHYQPRIELATGEVVGAEALVRWQHPIRGVLPPAAFLPLIEGSSLEFALDEWVLARALEQLEQWVADGLDWSVSVNISPRHIAQPGFPSYLAAVLAAHPAELASRLELEVLETSAIGQVGQVADVMLRCAELGVSFSLDDFGTGYSSLTYFHSLPVSVLKIDQDFVRNLLRNPHDLDIVEGVVQLASALHRPVVAEGVESIEIGMLLLGLGCQYAQGFGIARPMPAEALAVWVDGFASSPWRSLRSAAEGLSDRYDVGVALFTHRRWVDDVMAFVDSKGEGRAPATSSTSCPVGRWHQGVGRARYGSTPGYDELGGQHRRLHEIAASLIVRVVRDGGVSDADRDAFCAAASSFGAALEQLTSTETI